MSERAYRRLVYLAIALTLAFVGYGVYERFASRQPGDSAYHAGNTLFADGYYGRAAERYREALAADPEHLYALRGLARSLHKAGRHDEALATYDDVIARQPDFAATYANRGILHDTLGNHTAALRDYDRALSLDAELDEGPGWLTRFLRNQPDKPPTIGDRARYLRAELSKPEDERLLRVPEVDEAQRPYRM